MYLPQTGLGNLGEDFPVAEYARIQDVRKVDSFDISCECC